mmetsp:Transcript_17725/g.62434  ORF Transcript_17725/g.62434 Transcript_17725/m.62434 type:complete len:240 (-) Transcript_17725:1262-1981(-)
MSVTLRLAATRRSQQSDIARTCSHLANSGGSPASARLSRSGTPRATASRSSSSSFCFVGCVSASSALLGGGDACRRFAAKCAATLGARRPARATTASALLVAVATRSRSLTSGLRPAAAVTSRVAAAHSACRPASSTARRWTTLPSWRWSRSLASPPSSPRSWLHSPILSDRASWRRRRSLRTPPTMASRAPYHCMNAAVSSASFLCCSRHRASSSSQRPSEAAWPRTTARRSVVGASS